MKKQVDQINLEEEEAQSENEEQMGITNRLLYIFTIGTRKMQIEIYTRGIITINIHSCIKIKTKTRS